MAKEKINNFPRSLEAVNCADLRLIQVFGSTVSTVSLGPKENTKCVACVGNICTAELNVMAGPHMQDNYVLNPSIVCLIEKDDSCAHWIIVWGDIYRSYQGEAFFTNSDRLKNYEHAWCWITFNCISPAWNKNLVYETQLECADALLDHDYSLLAVRSSKSVVTASSISCFSRANSCGPALFAADASGARIVPWNCCGFASLSGDAYMDSVMIFLFSFFKLMLPTLLYCFQVDLPPLPARPNPDLHASMMAARKLMSEIICPSMSIHYRQAFNCFEKFYASVDVSVLPATPEHLAACLVIVASNTQSVSAVEAVCVCCCF